MIWHLENYDQETGSNTTDHLISNLEWSETMDQHIAAGFQSLAPSQIRAVDAFLETIAAERTDILPAEAAANARASYWAARAGD